MSSSREYLFILLIATTLAAQEPMIDPRGEPLYVEEEPAWEQGRRLVAVIGIDTYTGWPVLRNAVNDATRFSQVMTEEFGFESSFEPLLKSEATRSNITRFVAEDLRTELKPEDSLIFFSRATARAAGTASARNSNTFSNRMPIPAS